MLQKAQEDSPNAGKWERGLCPQRRLGESRENLRCLAVCQCLKSTYPKTFLKRNKSGFNNNLNDAEKKFKCTRHVIHKTQHFTLFKFSGNIFSSVFYGEICSSIYPMYV